MKDRINTIRAALKLLYEVYGWNPAEALTALDQIEAMAGEPVAWMNPHTGTTLSHKEKLRFLSLAGGQNYQGQNDDGMKAYAAAQTQPLYAAPVAQQQEPDLTSLLFAVEQAVKNGHCPWEIEAAFDEYEAARRAAPVAQQAEKRCQYCDGTGDVHSIDGQWLGECHCQKQPQAEAVPNTLQKAEARLLNLIGEYWALAYAEGEEGRNHDTEDGAAQRTHAAIAKAVNDLIAAASSAPQQAEAVPSDMARGAVAAEREACAALAQGYAGQVGDVAWAVAAAIRGRGNAAIAQQKGQP